MQRFVEKTKLFSSRCHLFINVFREDTDHKECVRKSMIHINVLWVYTEYLQYITPMCLKRKYVFGQICMSKLFSNCDKNY